MDMSPIRKLAGQTVVYGFSSIFGRFLNYLLVPLYTYSFPAQAYGIVSEFYAYAGFLAVLLGFGLETAYFRFRNLDGVADDEAYAAAMSLLLPGNLLFLSLVVGYQDEIASILRYPLHPEYGVWFAMILSIDGLCSLPFARLRAEERALRFAGVKLSEILITIGLNLLLILGPPLMEARWPGLMPRAFKPGIESIFLANLIGSASKLILLAPEFLRMGKLSGLRLTRPMLAYGLPMVIIGFAGMINEMLDRAVLKYLLPWDLDTNLRQLGIYGACYKLSILMTLFVQAFRYAGEPFFFSYAKRQDAKQTYALVMRYFVISCSGIYLIVVLFLDKFQYFIGAEYREGLAVVPVLLMANLFLGIYVNLSIWYKLTDRTGLGALVSIFGAVLTLVLNFSWVPHYGYMGSAWATLACYVFMVLISGLLGWRYYPIPYPVFRLTAYLLLILALSLAQGRLSEAAGLSPDLSAVLLLTFFLLPVLFLEVRPLLRRVDPRRIGP